ncbi:hypothetical protein G7Y29_07170 [Corynebacterium qintianiae]|uniref:Secreted protein n=1 Tax=Corynebacterium qintianiae TaxID=2709392 RepID=A0A7T0PD75_9CORY|nr:hypothetical protein [Corynebacterium qintianiae]QPK82663.1 hypothetical protein G7Y29_07170 [Corynebacterium qintianiae]
MIRRITAATVATALALGLAVSPAHAQSSNGSSSQTASPTTTPTAEPTTGPTVSASPNPTEPPTKDPEAPKQDSSSLVEASSLSEDGKTFFMVVNVIIAVLTGVVQAAGMIISVSPTAQAMIRDFLAK